ncbi:hypothetical protein WT08_00210 [Burkholderia sp. MSMB1552]|nr:hypothetical protein WT08_00210 [Burkholderia sp. MSMB1552]KWZ50474.1 hypothetical protein WS92_24080 [Burkholderia sp. MSMB1588]
MSTARRPISLTKQDRFVEAHTLRRRGIGVRVFRDFIIVILMEEIRRILNLSRFINIFIAVIAAMQGSIARETKEGEIEYGVFAEIKIQLAIGAL